jgi:hypothetical protein
MFWKHAVQGFAAKPIVDLHFMSEPEAALCMFWSGCKFGGVQYPLDHDETYPVMQNDELVLVYDVGGLVAVSTMLTQLLLLLSSLLAKLKAENHGLSSNYNTHSKIPGILPGS